MLNSGTLTKGLVRYVGGDCLVALGEGQMSLPACADAQVAECLKRRDIRPFQAACSLEESVLLVKCDLLLPKSKAAPELRKRERIACATIGSLATQAPPHVCLLLRKDQQFWRTST
jgi:hypothetical protein